MLCNNNDNARSEVSSAVHMTGALHGVCYHKLDLMLQNGGLWGVWRCKLSSWKLLKAFEWIPRVIRSVYYAALLAILWTEQCQSSLTLESPVNTVIIKTAFLLFYIMQFTSDTVLFHWCFVIRVSELITDERLWGRNVRRHWGQTEI